MSTTSRERRLNQWLEGSRVANTYTSLYYHIIFSTKNRLKSIHPETAPLTFDREKEPCPYT